MSDERATIRPVTLSRLVELTDSCEDGYKSTDELAAILDVTRRRARETILEAMRISLLSGEEDIDGTIYTTTSVGESFLTAIKAEDWEKVSSILAVRSPHYGAFLEALATVENVGLDGLLEFLEETHEYSPYSFNQTGIEIVGDWAERLGSVQRNAFTGNYYLSNNPRVPDNFHFILLDVYDELEQTTGINLRQRYLSIPRLREETCERIGCRRHDFDDAVLALCQQNVGLLELSGAPMDTAAKDAALGIKQLELADEGSLITTSQSTQQVMSGLELHGKKYYYFAVHNRNITFEQETH
ncbi:hypothetical protein NKF06_06780 [Haloferax sp. AB510]|uniref:hypothetical protein n=1 Tax=Haloferax sp. AB510 TaxID=2934172 RepID=UPI00209C1CA6|nr:hypothetical protein [Haloferax sp. AB510]MCO8266296.1 hypothetical protein [Haloferax sp. AB510]